MRVFGTLAAICVALAASASASASSHRNDVQEPFRGVNLGGWLVLESWITPSLYSNNSVKSGTGEWGFCEALGKAKCETVMQKHWDTWIVEEDIKKIAAAGFNHVRIPVGYWIVSIENNEPFVEGGWAYLEKALTWCSKHGIRAVVDLHAAPGSQNGHDNSGRVGPIKWTEPANVNRTVQVLAEIAKRVVALESSDPSMAGVVSGIETINEPWTSCVGGTVGFDTLKDFYARAYDAIRGQGFEGDVWISDGMCGSNDWIVGVLSPPQYQNVLIDSHIYDAFGGPTASMKPWDIVRYTCDTVGPDLLKRTDRDWTVVGEWSLATTHQNVPSNTSLAPTQPGPVGGGLVWMRAMFDSMVSAFEGTVKGGAPGQGPVRGWFFWCLKIEGNSPEWDALFSIEQGVLPANVSEGPQDEWAYTC